MDQPSFFSLTLSFDKNTTHLSDPRMSIKTAVLNNAYFNVSSMINKRVLKVEYFNTATLILYEL